MITKISKRTDQQYAACLYCKRRNYKIVDESTVTIYSVFFAHIRLDFCGSCLAKVEHDISHYVEDNLQ